MGWIDTLANNPLLVFSILCAFAAVVVVAYDVLNAREYRLIPRSAVKSGEPSNELQNRKRRPSVFDKITLLNRKLIQCPRCFRIEFVTVRFCSGCGMRTTNGRPSSSDSWLLSDLKDT